MIIRTPYSLEGYFQSAIIKKLKFLNPQFDYPNVASWQAVRPTLEEPVSREVIELELKSIESAWQRCLKLTKNGATKIHLVLHPKLYEILKKKKSSCMVENPIRNLEVYALPMRETKRRKITPKKKAKPIFIVKTAKKEQSSAEEDITEKFDSVKLTNEMVPFDLVPVLSPCGHLSYITRKSYEESKEKPDSDKVNFWRPLK